MSRFTRSRTATISAGGIYTLDHNISTGIELSIFELFCSSNKAVIVEILYSEDNGVTWINPWDGNSNIILKLYLAAFIPAMGKPNATWFIGGENRLIRVQITNPNAETADVYFLVKGWERNG